jgi:hypothetical protein
MIIVVSIEDREGGHHLCFRLPVSAELNVIICKLEEVRWSSAFQSWYLPFSPANLGKLREHMAAQRVMFTLTDRRRLRREEAVPVAAEAVRA